MKRIQVKIEEETTYRQRVVLDRLDMLLTAKVFNPSVEHGRESPIDDLEHRLLKSNRRFYSEGFIAA